MVICVECARAVNSTFKVFAGGSIRLTRCSYCQQVADKYVEFELSTILLDLMLMRVPVYRHILFNRDHDPKRPILERGIYSVYWKLLFLSLFFSAFIKVQRYHQDNHLSIEMTDMPMETIALLTLSVILEYVVFLSTVVGAIAIYFKNQYHLVMWNYLVMGQILATFGRPLLVIMIIWAGYGRVSSFILLLQLFVLVSNVVAVQDLSQPKSLAFVLLGISASFLCQLGLQHFFPTMPVYFM